MGGLLLKYLLGDLKIRQKTLAGAITKPGGPGGYGKTTMSHACNGRWDFFPKKDPEFKAKVEKYLMTREDVPRYLKTKGLGMSDIWNVVKNGGPVRTGGPNNPVRNTTASARASDGSREIEIKQEVEVLTQDALRRFKLFKNPFIAEIREVEDIYLSDEHRYIEAAMLDAAKHGGFIAVIGEVGSGKSVMRKKVAAELQKDDNARIIFPRSIDKTRLSAASICDAIVLDLSDETPRGKLEQKARQVERLLISRSKAGCHVVLLIEEAHDLTVRVLKLLKRFYEIEDGYKKALGIVLIGQPELGHLFNEADHYEMREVIRRCQVAEIRGLDGNIGDYLDFKFRRCKIDRKNIIDDGAVAALGNRLTVKNEKKRVTSYAYPLTVNNLVTRAMNLACDMGESLVTENVVNAL